MEVLSWKETSIQPTSTMTLQMVFDAMKAEDWKKLNELIPTASLTREDLEKKNWVRSSLHNFNSKLNGRKSYFLT